MSPGRVNSGSGARYQYPNAGRALGTEVAVAVAGPTAVADAGASLVAHLEAALTGVLTPHAIVLGTPTNPHTKDDVVVAVELTTVTENPHLRNGRWAPDPTVAPDTLALDLRYRITVRPVRARDGDPTSGTHRRHAILGHVLQALDDCTIADPHLAGTLAGGPPLRVTFDPTDETADHHDLAPWAPALHYRVSPVIIDPVENPSTPGRWWWPGPEIVPPIRIPKPLRRTTDS